MNEEKKKYINDLITECFKAGDKYIDMFSDQRMTLAEAQILVDYALKSQRTRIREEMDSFFQHLQAAMVHIPNELMDDRDAPPCTELKEVDTEIPEIPMSISMDILSAKHIDASITHLTNVTTRYVYTVTYEDGRTDVYHIFKCGHRVVKAVQIVKDSELLDKEETLTGDEAADIESAINEWVNNRYK